MITRAGDTLPRCEQPSSTHRAEIQILLCSGGTGFEHREGEDKDTGVRRNKCLKGEAANRPL